MEEQSKIKFLVNFGYAISVGLIIYFFAKFLLGFLLPFVVASLIAWCVQKPARIISNKLNFKSGIVAVFLSLIIFSIIAFLMFFVFYKGAVLVGDTINKMPQIIDYIGDIFEKFKGRIMNFNSDFSPKTVGTINEMENIILETVGTKLTGTLSSFAGLVAKKTPTYFLSILVTLVATCYISKDFERLIRFLKELCGEKVYGKIIAIKQIFSTSVWRLIKGYAIILTITFLELIIGFWFIGINRSVILALIISLVDLLPVLGTGTVLIPWGLIRIFLGFSDGFLILIIYIIITIVRNFSEPKIIGHQIGINPLFTLIVMFIGLKLIGFWGIIIFPIIFIVVFKYYKQQLTEN